jgi:hypothetical protein
MGENLKQIKKLDFPDLLIFHFNVMSFPGFHLVRDPDVKRRSEQHGKVKCSSFDFDQNVTNKNVFKVVT